MSGETIPFPFPGVKLTTLLTGDTKVSVLDVSEKFFVEYERTGDGRRVRMVRKEGGRQRTFVLCRINDGPDPSVLVLGKWADDSGLFKPGAELMVARLGSGLDTHYIAIEAGDG